MGIEVLLVEDNPGDVRLLKESFRITNEPVRLHVVSDGVEAMAFLRREGVHINAPRPDIILLDLNLPKMDGREVLVQIKQDISLKMIPTVVLSTSDSEVDVSICYKLQANCYLRKPGNWEAFDSIVNSINSFWLKNAKLPKRMQNAELS